MKYYIQHLSPFRRYLITKINRQLILSGGKPINGKRQLNFLLESTFDLGISVKDFLKIKSVSILTQLKVRLLSSRRFIARRSRDKRYILEVFEHYICFISQPKPKRIIQKHTTLSSFSQGIEDLGVFKRNQSKNVAA